MIPASCTCCSPYGKTSAPVRFVALRKSDDPPHVLAHRDLAQNWSIDVARDLEEYLDELESISISFDGGKTNLNFAEAALLIQVRHVL